MGVVEYTISPPYQIIESNDEIQSVDVIEWEAPIGIHINDAFYKAVAISLETYRFVIFEWSERRWVIVSPNSTLRDVKRSLGIYRNN